MERNHSGNLVKDIIRNNSVMLYEFGPVVQEENALYYISYLELWQPLCFLGQNYCAILVEGIMRINSVKLF